MPQLQRNGGGGVKLQSLPKIGHVYVLESEVCVGTPVNERFGLFRFSSPKDAEMAYRMVEMLAAAIPSEAPVDALTDYVPPQTVKYATIHRCSGDVFATSDDSLTPIVIFVDDDTGEANLRRWLHENGYTVREPNQ